VTHSTLGSFDVDVRNATVQCSCIVCVCLCVCVCVCVPVCVYVLQHQTELHMEGRLSVEGSVVVLEHLRASDAGQFKVVDYLGFPVTVLHLGLERKQGGGAGLRVRLYIREQHGGVDSWAFSNRGNKEQMKQVTNTNDMKEDQ